MSEIERQRSELQCRILALDSQIRKLIREREEIDSRILQEFNAKLERAK